MGNPRLTPGTGPTGIVGVRIPEDQRKKMEELAADAEISLSEFIRRSVLFCCAPDVLSEILCQLREERERKDPEVRKYVESMRTGHIKDKYRPAHLRGKR